MGYPQALSDTALFREVDGRFIAFVCDAPYLLAFASYHDGNREYAVTKAPRTPPP